MGSEIKIGIIKMIGRLKYFLVAWMICSNSLTFSQPMPLNRHFVDSVTPLLPTMHNDSIKVNTLQKLASMHLDLDPAKTVRYAEWGDSIAASIGYPEGRIACLGQLAFYYAFAGEWAKAAIRIDEAIPLCEKYRPEKLIYMHNLMYIVETTKGDSEMALFHVRTALHDPMFKNLSEENQWPTYFQLGRSYQEMNKLDSAQYFVSKLKAIVKAEGDPDNILSQNTSYLAGLISMKLKNYPQAIINFKIAHDYAGLAEAFRLSNRSDSAIFYAEKSLIQGRVRGNQTIILLAEKTLADVYAEIDLAKANYYLNMYVNSKDSVYNSQKFKQIEQINLERQRRDFELRKKITDDRNRFYYLLLFVILLSLAGLTLFLFRNNRFKQRSNQKLEAALSELKATQKQLIQSEKMASLGELTAGIAHEIQNPLNFVNNFSDLNSELVNEMKEEISRGNFDQVKLIAESMDENEKKIAEHGRRADSIVKGMLQHSRAGTGRKEPVDINALCEEYLRLAFHGMRAKDNQFNININTNFDPSIGKMDLVPQDIGRVLLNLYNNALYATRERKLSQGAGFEPAIALQTEKNGGKIFVRIADNGIGIPEKIKDKIFQPFFTTKPTGQGTGLGLSLSYDIIKAHGGDLSLGPELVNTPTDGEMTKTFIIMLPIKPD